MSVAMVSVSATDPDCATGIAQALVLASPGATIVVRPGVYREDLVFSADVTLVAEEGPGTVMIDASAGVGLLVQAGVVQLRDIEVRGAHSQIPTLQVSGGSLRLDRCDVQVAGVAAVHLLDGELQLHNSSVRNSQGAGLVIDGGAAEIVDCTLQDIVGTAVVVTGAAAPQFRRCTVKNVDGIGVLITGTATAGFDDCRFGPITGPAILVQDAARPRFQAAVIEQSQVGLYVTDRAAPLLSSCCFRSAVSHGVMIMEDARPALTDCTIEDSAGHAVHAAGRSAGTFTGCRVLRSGAASLVAVEDAEPRFTGGEIAQGREVGALATGRSRMTLEDLSIRDVSIGVSIEEEAEPMLRSVRIRGGRCGVVGVGGGGLLEDSEIVDAEWSAVRIGGTSRLSLQGNRLHGGQAGVTVTGTGIAVISGTRIDGSTDVGLMVEQEATAEVDGCRITGSSGPGVHWDLGSRGVLRNSEVTGNSGDGILVASSSGVTLEKCRLRDNGGEAVRLSVPAATVTSTDLDLGETLAGPVPPAPPVPASIPLVQASTPSVPASTLSASAPSAAAPTAPPAADPVKAVLAQLQTLAGLETVKRELSTLVGLHRLARRQAQAGIQPLPPPRHLILAGPSGTGKTTVAGLYAQILAALGVIADGRLVVARRSELVVDPLAPSEDADPADPVDSSVAKTTAKVQEALGGVLFLPEAHLLTGGGAGRAVLDTLVGLMDQHRDDLVVVAAGPVAAMSEFLVAGPGLTARFSRTVEFAELSSADLIRVVELQCHSHHYVLEPDTRDELGRYFEALPRPETFGNARAARRVFEDMLGRQAYRLAENPDVAEVELASLQPTDVPGRDG